MTAEISAKAVMAEDFAAAVEDVQSMVLGLLTSWVTKAMCVMWLRMCVHGWEAGERSSRSGGEWNDFMPDMCVFRVAFFWRSSNEHER